ncbi:MAG: methyltransferase domain-containing protein [Planctomycetes bacterium]|nr:methyltransferase domain-containing protein [Planctomycetota bacterium]MBU1518715.1 methyltransferase domain-containing protein [Planctomycetota bacterium]MBU2458723.1 methyltransferase domain-containing protein [Planctomycetota bacterium]MBU2597545.1 methyltransferase domain-containing protein [Planctomycetota bacterium]
MKETTVFTPEITTVWSFPERGNWATHKPSYRGNFAPQIARNIIEMYSQRGETILDPMVGGGTTLIEAKLLVRNAIGLDINPKAIEITKEALKFNHHPASNQIVKTGDARDLSFIKDNSIDLVITHPPYMNIIKYLDGQVDGDLSNIGNMPIFCDEIEKIAKELFRVLKPDRYCAILIGDTRKSRHFVPLAYNVMQRFLKIGFVLKEDIIKVQHNCSSTGQWVRKAQENKFYLIMHEHLFVFRKPTNEEDLGKIKYSSKM